MYNKTCSSHLSLLGMILSDATGPSFASYSSTNYVIYQFRERNKNQKLTTDPTHRNPIDSHRRARKSSSDEFTQTCPKLDRISKFQSLRERKISELNNKSTYTKIVPRHRSSSRVHGSCTNNACEAKP